MGNVEDRLRLAEQEIATLKAQMAPLLDVHTLLAGLSNQVTELRGELRTLRGQAIVGCAIASFLGPFLLKLLHI